MEEKDILAVFEQTKALLSGHFLLTSGAHSPTYFQCAKVLQHPAHTSSLCSALIKQIGLMDVDTVISPAIGGIVVGQEMGRLLNKRTIFAEREDGKMTLRRGFSVAEGEKVLVVEDVVTTGGSVQEVIDLVKEEGGEVTGVAVIVDRSNGQADFGVPFHPLVQLEVVKYGSDSCPLCKEEMALIKPGSRKVF